MGKVDTEAAQKPEYIDSIEESEGKPLHEHVTQLIAGIDLLWAHRRSLLWKTFAAGAITFALAFLLPNRYTATVDLNPPDMNPVSGLSLLVGAKMGGIASALSGQMGDVLGLKTPGQVYIRQMQSRSVEDQIIDRFDLQKVYHAKLRERARKLLESNTVMTEDRKSGVITIAVEDEDPSRAAQMANAYPEELGRLLSDLNSSAGRREREYFETQLVAAKLELDKATTDLSVFAGKNAALDVPEQGKALVEGAATVQGQLIAAESELKGLQQVYTDRYEGVQAAKAKIAELRRQLAQIEGKEVASGKAGNASLDRSKTADLQPSAKALSVLAVPYLDLYRRMKVQEAVVETITQQYEFAKLQESRHVTEVQVLTPAEIPEKKSSPHRGQMALAAALLTLCATSSWIFGRRWFEQADPRDPWKMLLEPKLSAIRSRRAWRFAWGKAVSAEVPSTALKPLGELAHPEVEICQSD